MLHSKVYMKINVSTHGLSPFANLTKINKSNTECSSIRPTYIFSA